jgi:hypothetical protein
VAAHGNILVRATKLLDSNTDQCSEKSSQGSDKLRTHSSSLGETGLDEECKVANLVGDLVEEDSDSGGSSDGRRGVETGRHGQTIGNVVSKVGAVFVSKFSAKQN